MAPTLPAKKKPDFDPRKFLAPIGEGRRVVSFSQKQFSRRKTGLMQSSTSRKARLDSLSYPKLARKRLWEY
jgi:hypothetical protein